MSNHDEIVRKIRNAINSQELIELARDLIKINTVWDPANESGEEPAVRHIADWAERKGYQVEINTVAKGRLNAILTWSSGRPGRVLMFEGHTDVVTPGDVNAWRYPPFGAQIVGDRLYGRGANDTKGNLAAMLIAMTALKYAGVRVQGSMIGGVLCDEEGEMSGVRDFIRRGHADAVTAAIICEPQDGMLCISQKGALRVEFTIRGRMSHGAMPLAGVNTAPALARLIDGLHQLERRAAEKLGREKHLGWPSFTPTVVQAPCTGEAQLNVMPGEARLLADIRTVPGQSHEDLRQAINALADSITARVATHYQEYDARLGVQRKASITIETAFLTDRPCTLTAYDDPIVKAADWATRRITGREPVYGGVPGATDGTYLWSRKNIPIITMGAGDREVPHQVDEWVNIQQLIETAHIYALTAFYYLGGEAP